MCEDCNYFWHEHGTVE